MYNSPIRGAPVTVEVTERDEHHLYNLAILEYHLHRTIELRLGENDVAGHKMALEHATLIPKLIGLLNNRLDLHTPHGSVVHSRKLLAKFVGLALFNVGRDCAQKRGADCAVNGPCCELHDGEGLREAHGMFLQLSAALSVGRTNGDRGLTATLHALLAELKCQLVVSELLLMVAEGEVRMSRVLERFLVFFMNAPTGDESMGSTSHLQNRLNGYSAQLREIVEQCPPEQLSAALNAKFPRHQFRTTMCNALRSIYVSFPECMLTRALSRAQVELDGGSLPMSEFSVAPSPLRTSGYADSPRRAPMAERPVAVATPVVERQTVSATPSIVERQPVSATSVEQKSAETPIATGTMEQRPAVATPLTAERKQAAATVTMTEREPAITPAAATRAVVERESTITPTTAAKAAITPTAIVAPPSSSDKDRSHPYAGTKIPGNHFRSVLEPVDDRFAAIADGTDPKLARFLQERALKATRAKSFDPLPSPKKKARVAKPKDEGKKTTSKKKEPVRRRPSSRKKSPGGEASLKREASPVRERSPERAKSSARDGNDDGLQTTIASRLRDGSGSSMLNRHDSAERISWNSQSQSPSPDVVMDNGHENVSITSGTSGTSDSKVKPPKTTPSGKRVPRRFSDEETQHLIEGVRRFGNDWCRILKSYQFDNRTNVDLKDRARVLTKSGRL